MTHNRGAVHRFVWPVFFLLTANLSAESIVDAAKAGDKVALRAFVQKKADVNATDADGSTVRGGPVNRDDLEKAPTC